jgi:hypothetical protein
MSLVGATRENEASPIRDYLVPVTPGSDELLLGKAFMAPARPRLPGLLSPRTVPTR